MRLLEFSFTLEDKLRDVAEYKKFTLLMHTPFSFYVRKHFARITDSVPTTNGTNIGMSTSGERKSSKISAHLNPAYHAHK